MFSSIQLALFLSFTIKTCIGYGPAQQHYRLSENVTRVPVILGVMSRCPDALLCESVLDTTFKKTWPLISLDLSFIAKKDSSDATYGVTCMHGVEECAGNVQELCAIHLTQNQKQWWSFVQCLNYEGRWNVGNIDLAEKCAGVAEIPWEDEGEESGMKTCIESDVGKNLLVSSLTQTQKLGITKSCSIMISGKIRCIHDGIWVNCETGHTSEEFETFIRQEYDRLNPE
ncbi:hypothetical protein Clacol_001305 [Clathrus columnatus]|uniref:Uncharacterized protein n=1 Tax=Clathrus columnatus TaxID=1419009 RepID=A0AAV5A5D1_9AGAM|nr:hypothetical protein Clacol_001305 [Clathrus columnatus]